MKPFSKMGLWLFIKEFFRHPMTVGSAVPSSLLLAKTIAAQVPQNTAGYIVEVGPGTGVVTEALLKAGFSPEKLILVERSESFYQHLKKRFPHLMIIHGDAMYLDELLAKQKQHVSVIVSSLPLRSLPVKVGKKIAEQLKKVLLPGGVFIQFTYSLMKTHVNLPTFKYAYSSYIWRNLPPARVDVFRQE